MNTLGLDVSPLRIGWAVYDNDALTDHGTITFNTNDWVTPGMRSDAIEDTLDKYTIDQVAAEAVFVGINKLGSIRAAMALGQVESICDYLWPEAPQKILTATQWRKLCDISQGGKKPVMDWALAKCDEHGLAKPDTQDAADAIAIAYAGYLWFSNE